MKPREEKEDADNLFKKLIAEIKLPLIFAGVEEPAAVQKIVDLQAQYNIEKLQSQFNNERLEKTFINQISNAIDAIKEIDVIKNDPNKLKNIKDIEQKLYSEMRSPSKPIENTQESRKNEEKEYSTFGKMRDSFQAVKKPFKSAMKQLKESIQEKVDDFRSKPKR